MPLLWPEWAWKLYVVWVWLLGRMPVTHSKAFYWAREEDLDWIAYHAANALRTLEERGEDGWMGARTHLLEIARILDSE